MKKLIWGGVAVAMLPIFLLSMKAIVRDKKVAAGINKPEDFSVRTDAKNFALVELFTSEGCSSCPPADELIGELVKENRGNVYVLAYHVDYWDRLGWKDPFSSHLFSERQRDYSIRLGLDGVYTPQIVVNGTQEFVGSNSSKLYSSLHSLGEENPVEKISLIASYTNGLVNIKYSITANKKATLNIALVQLKGTSQVGNGENRGRFLQHINIVRELKTIPFKDMDGQLNLEVPAAIKGFNVADYKVVAFLQENKGGVLAVSGAAIQ